MNTWSPSLPATLYGNHRIRNGRYYNDGGDAGNEDMGGCGRLRKTAAVALVDWWTGGPSAFPCDLSAILSIVIKISAAPYCQTWFLKVTDLAEFP